LHRFSAIAGDNVDPTRFTAPLFQNEAACYLSHLEALKSQADANDHVFILEDDAIFSTKTFEVLDVVLEKIDFEWDIFYTDVSINNPALMLDFFKKRRDFESTSWIHFLDLKSIPFAAASGYIINKKSIAKITTLLSSEAVLKNHIDLYYRGLIHAGLIKGFVAFPFLTSLSNLSEHSQIQPETTQYTEIAWNTFRKLMWIDRSIESCQPNIQKLQAHFMDAEMNAYATILSAVISPKFIPK
jgi:GR25 family glycosyltransferase involved in LPS biosynthesis